jgi:hypothetical protein
MGHFESSNVHPVCGWIGAAWLSSLGAEQITRQSATPFGVGVSSWFTPGSSRRCAFLREQPGADLRYLFEIVEQFRALVFGFCGLVDFVGNVFGFGWGEIAVDDC